jgi:hypothetical protein
MALFKDSPDPGIEPIPRSEAALAHLHYGPQGSIISALHQDVSGRAVNGDPMALLAPAADPMLIGTAILSALAHSRDGLTEQEADRQTKAFLQLLGPQKWNDFQSQWNVISVCQEAGSQEVLIFPSQRVLMTGCGTRVNEYYSRPALPERVGQLLLHLVKRASREITE